MKHLLLLSACAACLGLFLSPVAASADSAKAVLSLTTEKGDGEAVGTVAFSDEDGALVIRTDLHGLPPGVHGFHIHEKGACGPTEKDGKITPAGAAGGHYDPEQTGKHLGPGGGGHKGDLPPLTVGQDGTATVTLRVPGLSAAEIKNRSIMIHAGGDNFADTPETLGGGGARLACGVIE